MVPLTQRDSFMMEVQNDSELQPLRAFVFGERVQKGLAGGTTRAKLFNSLYQDDTKAFQEHVDDLARRNISPESEWIGDDCVLFLLLLGVRKFGLSDALVSKILACRRVTSNLQTQQVNQAFDAIQRNEFAMEGDCAFIKAVFLQLADAKKLSSADSSKLYRHLTRPGAIHNLDAFSRLLAIRAFDLVIETQERADTERNWEHVFTKLQDDGPKLSLWQFIVLLKHLRLSVIVSIFAFISSVFLFGRGCAWLATKSTPTESLITNSVRP
jgi:hypothetical protein